MKSDGNRFVLIKDAPGCKSPSVIQHLLHPGDVPQAFKIDNIDYILLHVRLLQVRNGILNIPA